jgi:hypothetical protein
MLFFYKLIGMFNTNPDDSGKLLKKIFTGKSHCILMSGGSVMKNKQGLIVILLVFIVAGGIVSGSANGSANNTGISEGTTAVFLNVSVNTPMLENGSSVPADTGILLQPLSGNIISPTIPGSDTVSGQDDILKGSPSDLGYYRTRTLNFGIKPGTHPAIVSRSSGLLDMFYYNTTGYVYTAYNTQGNKPDWPAEYAIDTLYNNWVYSPAVSSWGSNNLMLFAVNDLHYLWYCRWNDAGWFGFTLVPGSTDASSTPAVVSRMNGNIELVYVNTTAQLKHITYTEGSGWGSPEIIDTRVWPYGEGVSLVSTSSDSFTVIGRWSTQVWTRTWTVSGGWGAWQNTGIPAYSFVGASVRKYSDALSQSNTIDLVTDYYGSPSTYYWYVSQNNGGTWAFNPYAPFIINNGGPFVIGSSRYNRVEFYQEGLTGYIREFAIIAPDHDKIAVTNGVDWYLDKDGNGVYSGSDAHHTFGGTGWTPVVGEWNGNGIAEIGVTNGVDWYLDWNGDGTFTGSDVHYTFGGLGWKPVVGDWNADGRQEIGVTNGVDWYLDYNGDGSYSDFADIHYTFGGLGWTPVVGDWNNFGSDKIGVSNGVDWYLDYNGDGTYSDLNDIHAAFGAAGWTPIIGEWNGDGFDEIGVTNGVEWYLDSNTASGGYGVYSPGVDDHYTFGGLGWTPVIGDWNGNGNAEIGVSNGVDWYLDKDGNGIYGGSDAHYTFGGAGWTPVTGEWS